MHHRNESGCKLFCAHGDRSLYGDQTACFRIPNTTVCGSALLAFAEARRNS